MYGTLLCSLGEDLARSQCLVSLGLSLHEPLELASVGLAQCSPRLGCYTGSICDSPWSLIFHAGDICNLVEFVHGLKELVVWALAEIILNHGPLAWLSFPDALVSSL